MGTRLRAISHSSGSRTGLRRQAPLTLSPGYQAVNTSFRTFGVRSSRHGPRCSQRNSCRVSVYLSLSAIRKRPRAGTGNRDSRLRDQPAAESRLALPEIPALLAMLLAFLLLVVGRKTTWIALLAGLSPLVRWVSRDIPAHLCRSCGWSSSFLPEGGPRRQRGIRTLAFSGGFLLPIAAGLWLGGGARTVRCAGADSAALAFSSSCGRGPTLMVWRYFESSQLNSESDVAWRWFCSWIWFHRDSKRVPPVTREVYFDVRPVGGMVARPVDDHTTPRTLRRAFRVPVTIHVIAGLSPGRGRHGCANTGTLLEAKACPGRCWHARHPSAIAPRRS